MYADGVHSFGCHGNVLARTRGPSLQLARLAHVTGGNTAENRPVLFTNATTL